MNKHLWNSDANVVKENCDKHSKEHPKYAVHFPGFWKLRLPCPAFTQGEELSPNTT